MGIAHDKHVLSHVQARKHNDQMEEVRSVSADLDTDVGQCETPPRSSEMGMCQTIGPIGNLDTSCFHVHQARLFTQPNG